MTGAGLNSGDQKSANPTKGKNPSTAKGVLTLLALNNPGKADFIRAVSDFRIIDQVCKTSLRAPDKDKDNNFIIDPETGEYVYEKGLPSCIEIDGRVRTFLSPTAETGRTKSSSPNMQNWSNSRQDDYRRIIGADVYDGNRLRSMIIPDPGWYFVESDYVAAELFAVAVQSGDKLLLEHALRSNLDDSHPDYMDLHSSNAVLAYGLNCPPTKKGLKSIGKYHLRQAVKVVAFGTLYGQGPAALAQRANEVREAGTPEINKQEAQRIIDAFFNRYNRLYHYRLELQEYVEENLMITNLFGRHRRFSPPLDEVSMGNMKRQALNFPIQSVVAGALSRGIAFMEQGNKIYKKKYGKLLFRWQLPIHDAVLIQVQGPNLKYVTKTFLPWALSKQAPLQQAGPDGKILDDKQYYLGLETKISKRWGEPLTDREKEEVSQWLNDKE